MNKQKRFQALLKQYGNIAELARKSGLSRRALEYKRDGKRRLTMWDIWAIEKALELKQAPTD